MNGPEFSIGDFVEIICRPAGDTYCGFLDDFNDVFITLNGPRAFPCEDILVMTHG